MHRIFFIVSVQLSLTFQTVIAAEQSSRLTVVADFGGESARPYYASILATDTSDQKDSRSDRTAPFSIADMLPVRTPELTPGWVESRSLDLPVGFQPIFIVGDDPASLDWLSAKADELRRTGAAGIAVNVASEQAFWQIQQAAPGVSIDPVSGHELAVKIGIRHYPVLITRTELVQ